MIPTGPNTNPEKSFFSSGDATNNVVEVSLLLRGNSVEFLIRTSELDKLEQVLMNILSMPMNEMKLVKLETVIGTINFTASHLTGWIVFDNPDVQNPKKH